jgi:hypothetical protein
MSRLERALLTCASISAFATLIVVCALATLVLA